MSPCLLKQDHGRGSHGFGWLLSTPSANIPPTFATEDHTPPIVLLTV